ncbi:MAG: ParB N-terminal domain-containing protein [Collinsella stercoris]|nr:ParB N-terminal domain-containing protein [Collinsella stercoris]
MQFEKKSVRLGDIRPSGQNPREDFGDIGALARSIEATGGEPLNPPVVVADGNVYRIVDGERRYRALSSIYGEDREVSALVAESMGEANELVAMLATDDKRQLTEAERARGVQQMLVLGIDEQRIERASRATAGQIRAARRLRGRIDAGVQVTLEQLEAASAFDDEKDVEAVLAAGEGWAVKADSIRRRVEREEAKAEDYDAFGDAGIPVVKEQPEGFVYKDWVHVGLVASKLEGKEFAAGTVAVWKGSYWNLYEPDDGSGAEPEKTEEEIRAEQEAEREDEALKDLYRRMVGFITSGAFTMHDDLERIVREARVEPVVVADAIGGDPSFETDKRIAGAREEFMARLGTSGPSEYEAGFRLMAAARDMVRLNSSYRGDDAEGWLEHWGMFRSAGFEPGGDDEWLLARVQESAEEEEKDE